MTYHILQNTWRHGKVYGHTFSSPYKPEISTKAPGDFYKQSRKSLYIFSTKCELCLSNIRKNLLYINWTTKNSSISWSRRMIPPVSMKELFPWRRYGVCNVGARSCGMRIYVRFIFNWPCPTGRMPTFIQIVLFGCPVNSFQFLSLKIYFGKVWQDTMSFILKPNDIFYFKLPIKEWKKTVNTAGKNYFKNYALTTLNYINKLLNQ